MSEADEATGSSAFCFLFSWARPLSAENHVDSGEKQFPLGRRHYQVSANTDYGLLTILKQDETGGLQVKSQGRWISAPPIPGTFLSKVSKVFPQLRRDVL